jgi:hypothetical protein
MKHVWLARLLVLVIAAALAIAPARFAAMAAAQHDAVALVAAEHTQHAPDCGGGSDLPASDMMASCLTQCAPPATLPALATLVAPEPAEMQRAPAPPTRFGQHPAPQEPPPKSSL